VTAKVQLIEFTMNHEAAYQSLAAVCEPLDIGVLVNNVGKSHEMPTYFVDTTQEEVNDILAINVHATLRMTSMVLPGMIQRKRGLILNMGSFLARFHRQCSPPTQVQKLSSRPLQAHLQKKSSHTTSSSNI